MGIHNLSQISNTDNSHIYLDTGHKKTSAKNKDYNDKYLEISCMADKALKHLSSGCR